MKAAALSFVFASLALLGAGASAQSSAPPQLKPAPPPPGLNDPGVKSRVANPAVPSKQPVALPDTSPAELSASQLPGKPIPLPAMRDPGGNAITPADGRDQQTPDVKVRQDGDNTVQEYSRAGQVYMVVVTPRVGPAQTYMVDPDGKWHNQPGAPKVQPVMYKVLEWGKPRPNPDQEGSGQ